MGELGNTLSRARRARGITVEDAERDTHVSRRYLNALESEDFSLFPAPVYARGFLRTYSRYLGLNPEELVRVFPNGDLTVDSGNAQVEADGVKGNANIDTSFGAISVKNVTGSATLTSNNGNVKASDIGGALTVTARFGTVRVDRVKSATTVDASNGSVTLGEIGGNVKVRGSFGSVFLDGVSGAIDVANSNGAISVSNVRGNGCHPVSLRTNFSSIKVALPDSAAYAVNARTSFGRIHTDFPITTTSLSDENIAGTIGKGGCKLDLVNANGNITIEKE